MSGAITPGLHDFSREFYDSDPCPEPSLTSAGIRLLLEASPAHFAAQHPRLSRWPERITRARDESLGAVVKHLVLGSEHEIAALPFDDWSTKIAQAQRERAREDGQIPVTRGMYAEAQSVAAEAQAQLAEFFRRAGALHSSCVTMIWRRRCGSCSIWCREWVDQVRGLNRALIVQTVTRAATDEEVAHAVQHSGLDLKAAWLLDGLAATLPREGREHHVEVVTIETKPPYIVTVKPLGADWLEQARGRVEVAVRNFAAGLAGGHWPYISAAAALERPVRKGV